MSKWRICPNVPLISEHHHDRTGRYCYWMWYGKFGKLWQVRDRVTGREVCCLNITQARRWIAAAKAFKVGRNFVIRPTRTLMRDFDVAPFLKILRKDKPCSRRG